MAYRSTDAERRSARPFSGPKPPARRISSVIRRDTGLKKPFPVLRHENLNAYEVCVQTLYQQLQPAPGHEQFLVRQMAIAQWRIQRLKRFEDLAYVQMFGPVDKSDPDAIIVHELSRRCGRVLDVIHGYLAAADQSYHRARRELVQSRARQNRNRAGEIEILMKERFESNFYNPILFDNETCAEKKPTPVLPIDDFDELDTPLV